MNRLPLRVGIAVAVCMVAGTGLTACSPQPSISGVPPEPPPAVRRGDEAFRYQDYDRAIDAYGSYLEKVRTGPYTAVAEYKSALAAYRLKRYDQTLYILDDLDSRYPEGKWMQVDALRGDAERALGRNMLAIRAWADAWELAGPEDRERLARRFQGVARAMDVQQLAEARTFVDNEDVRDLLYPQGPAIPVIAEPLHEPDDEAAAVASGRRGQTPPKRVDVPEDDDAAAWAPPPDLAELPTSKPAAVAPVPSLASSPAARVKVPVPTSPVVAIVTPAPTATAQVPPTPDLLPPTPLAAPSVPVPVEPVEVASLPSSPPDTAIDRADARVGVLLPVNGPHAAAGKAAWQAIRLAFGDAASRLVLVDTGAGNVRVDIDKLWGNPDVVAVIGPFEAAGNPEAGAPVDGLPALVLPGAPDTGPAQLSLGASRVDLLGPLLRYATAVVQIRRFAILYPDTPIGRTARDAIANAVDNLGRTVVGTVGYPAGGDAVAVAGGRLIDWREKDNLDAVFLADDVAPARALATFLRREMPDVTLLGAAQWDALADGGVATDGILFAESFYPGSTRPATRDFVVAYDAAYGGQPGGLAAQAYDVATVARRALALGVDSRSAMRERVREVGAVNGATGLVEVGEEGLSRPGFVLQVYDGKLAEVGRSS
ncbi:ABC transporter substrate-binding protein [Candidatus Binatia bacterium]|nr:ABC transporter substrate-binding protein [Candidatus Binatia bacterium]